MTEEDVIAWLTNRLKQDIQTGEFWKIVNKGSQDAEDGLIERQTRLEVKDGRLIEVVRSLGITTKKALGTITAEQASHIVAPNGGVTAEELTLALTK